MLLQYDPSLLHFSLKQVKNNKGSANKINMFSIIMIKNNKYIKWYILIKLKFFLKLFVALCEVALDLQQ